MFLKDLEPYIIQAASKEITQTALTTAVLGSSGTGNQSMTRVLLPRMVTSGLLEMRTKGNAKYFTATEKGKATLSQTV